MGDGKGGPLQFFSLGFLLGLATCVFSIITCASWDTFWNQKVHLILGINTNTKITFNPFLFIYLFLLVSET
jgi:hypothetical protein